MTVDGVRKGTIGEMVVIVSAPPRPKWRTGGARRRPEGPRQATDNSRTPGMEGDNTIHTKTLALFKENEPE